MIAVGRESNSTMWTPLWAIICVLALSAIPVTSQCPDVCQCAKSEVVCNEPSVSEVGPMPENTTDVTMTGTNVTVIYNDTFTGLSRLGSLALSNNLIHFISPTAFHNLHNLKYIRLDSNRLTTIENGTFSNLRLEKLTLNNNPDLVSIDTGVFVNTELRTLELSGCNFHTLEADVFRHLKVSLVYLTLSFNLRPLHLTSGVFRGFTFEQIVLQYDNLSSVSFLSGVAAALVDLTGNRLLGNGVWNITRDMSMAQEVILSDVSMTSVEIDHESGIEGLDLSSNNIEHLNGSQFQYTKNLFSLILTNNRLTQIPTELGQFVPRLIILILNHNDLGPVIDMEAFNGTTLHVLELQHCGIQTLPASARSVFRDMRTVKLLGNPLHCNCELRWLNEWARSLRYGDTDLRLGVCASPNTTSGESFQTKRPPELICSTPLMVFTAKGPAEVGKPLVIICKASGEPAPNISLVTAEGASEGITLAHQESAPSRTVTETYLQYTITLLHLSARWGVHLYGHQPGRGRLRENTRGDAARRRLWRDNTPPCHPQNRTEHHSCKQYYYHHHHCYYYYCHHYHHHT